MRVFSFTNEETSSTSSRRESVDSKRNSTRFSVVSDEDVQMMDYLFADTDYCELPYEIILSIMYYLPRRDLLQRARLVSKQWYHLAMNDALWYHHTFISNPFYYSKVELENGSIQTVYNEKKKPFQLFPNPSYCHKVKNGEISTQPAVSLRLQCKNYYMEQLSLLRCSMTTPLEEDECDKMVLLQANSAETPTAGTPSTIPSTPTSMSSLISMISGASSTPTPQTPQGQSQKKSSHLFFRDCQLEEHLFENKKYQRPAQTYRHTLTTVPSMASGAQTSDKIYIIGGLHNTLNVQPPELREDFVQTIEMVDSSTMTPSSPGSSLITPSTPTNPSSPSSFNFKKLFTFGKEKRLEKLSGFKKVRVQGKPPHLGKHSTVLYEKAGHPAKLIIFGGVVDNNVSNDLYTYDLETNVWEKDEYSKHDLVPAPRTNHSCVVIGNLMWLIGGGIGQNMTPTNEIWTYNLETHIWKRVENVKNIDVFTPRLGCAATEINGRILIYGGGYWLQRSLTDRYWRDKYTDLFIFDTTSLSIAKVDMSHNMLKPEVGTFPASVLVGTQWYIIGGAFENKISYDVFCLDLVSLRWRKFTEKFYGGDSLSACHFVTAEKQNKILVFGGYCFVPLDKLCVLSLRYKDVLDSRGIQSIEPIL